MARRRNDSAHAVPSHGSDSRCRPGSATAASWLVAGLMLMLGTIVIAVYAPAADALGDTSDVVSLLRRAEGGDARAAFLLGMRYARPDESGRDDVEAVRWLRQAADQGLAEAQYNLGIMYAGGRGVPRDSGQAARWYRQAAEQGLAGAQYNLGAQYAVGDGVPRDEQRAATWFERAALQEVPEAAYNLGVLYDLGRGVEADVATAMEWYERAAASGYHPAASRLVALRAANPELAAKSRASSSPAASGEPAAKPTKPDATVSTAVPPVAPAATSSAATAVAPATAKLGAAGPLSASPWLARRNPDHYTLQLLSHTNEASVRRYLSENFKDGEAGYFAFERDGKTWYTVVYGDYASYSEATAAGESLAEQLDGTKPWTRKIAIIQKAAIR